MVDDAKFWISYQRQVWLSRFDRWQLIQNLASSTIVWRQCDIQIGCTEKSNLVRQDNFEHTKDSSKFTTVISKVRHSQFTSAKSFLLQKQPSNLNEPTWICSPCNKQSWSALRCNEETCSSGQIRIPLGEPCKLDTVQDFLFKLGIKPRMHLWEISIFSLNNVIVRPTKIMNRADNNWAHF